MSRSSTVGGTGSGPRAARVRTPVVERDAGANARSVSESLVRVVALRRLYRGGGVICLVEKGAGVRNGTSSGDPPGSEARPLNGASRAVVWAVRSSLIHLVNQDVSNTHQYADKEDVMRRVRFKASSSVNADDGLLKLWGKPLSVRDARICEALGWAQEVATDVGSQWRITLEARKFEGSIYIRGKPAQFRCDEALQSRLFRQQLICLDQFFGVGTGREMRLRCVLTLAHMVIADEAACIQGKDALLFCALTTMTAGSMITDMVRRGECCVLLNDYGEQDIVPTLKGLLNSLTEADVDDLGIRALIAELSARGLMKLRARDGGASEWVVTPEGEQFGLCSTHCDAMSMLETLGLDSYVDLDDDDLASCNKIKRLH